LKAETELPIAIQVPEDMGESKTVILPVNPCRKCLFYQLVSITGVEFIILKRENEGMDSKKFRFVPHKNSAGLYIVGSYFKNRRCILSILFLTWLLLSSLAWSCPPAERVINIPIH
jgi:hypothetical protein